LSIESVGKIAEGANCSFCTGCFSGNYPIDVPSERPFDKFNLKLSQ
jgi:amidophosphoribosyltransferase